MKPICLITITRNCKTGETEIRRYVDGLGLAETAPYEMLDEMVKRYPTASIHRCG